MNAEEAELKFPVLGFERDGWMEGFPDLRRLTSIRRLDLKYDEIIGLELIDASGRRWIVRSVRRTGRSSGPLLNWLIWGLLSAGFEYRIEHELEELSPVSLGEIKDRVYAAIALSDIDDYDNEAPGEIADVRAATSVVEIYRRKFPSDVGYDWPAG